MDNLEKKLNDLPKGRMSLRKDAETRLVLRGMMARDRLERFGRMLSFPRLAPVAALIALLLVVIALPGYAYASSQVTAGHILYPIKKAVENIELKLANGRSEEAAIYQKFSKKRIAEAEALSSKEKTKANEQALAATIEEAMQLDRQASEGKSEIPAPEKESDVARLEKVAESVGLEAEDRTLDAITSALDSFRGKDRIEEVKKRLEKAAIRAERVEKQPESRIEPEKAEERKAAKPEEPAKPEAEKKEPAEKSGELGKEDAKLILESIKKDIETLKSDLKTSGYEEKDIEKLSQRLEKKIKQTEDEIDEDDSAAANSLLVSTEALAGNAKHFIKKKEKEAREIEIKENDKGREDAESDEAGSEELGKEDRTGSGEKEEEKESGEEKQ